MIKIISIAIGRTKFAELQAAGIPSFTQDFMRVNAKRIEEMRVRGTNEVREGIGDTGKQILFQKSTGSQAFSAAELVEKILNFGAVVALKEKVVKDHKTYFLVVREVEIGEEVATDISLAARTLIMKAARKWFRTVVVWANPNATITVNMSGDFNEVGLGEVDKVQQVVFGTDHSAHLI